MRSQCSLGPLVIILHFCEVPLLVAVNLDVLLINFGEYSDTQLLFFLYFYIAAIWLLIPTQRFI